MSKPAVTDVFLAPFVNIIIPVWTFMVPLMMRGGGTLVNGRPAAEVVDQSKIARIGICFSVVYSAYYLVLFSLFASLAVKLSPGSEARAAFLTDMHMKGVPFGSICDFPSVGYQDAPPLMFALLILFLQLLPALVCAAMHIAYACEALGIAEPKPPVGPRNLLWPEMIQLASRFFEDHKGSTIAGSSAEADQHSVATAHQGQTSWWLPAVPPSGYHPQGMGQYTHLCTDATRSASFLFAPPASVPQLPPTSLCPQAVPAAEWSAAIELPNQYLAAGQLEDAPLYVTAPFFIAFLACFVGIFVSPAILSTTASSRGFVPRLLISMLVPWLCLVVVYVLHHLWGCGRKRERNRRERVAYAAAQAALNAKLTPRGIYVRLHGERGVQVARSRNGRAHSTRVYHFRCTVYTDGRHAGLQTDQGLSHDHYGDGDVELSSFTQIGGLQRLSPGDRERAARSMARSSSFLTGIQGREIPIVHAVAVESVPGQDVKVIEMV